MPAVEKPLRAKAYGSICHLPGSRLGPGDHKLNPGQARILTEKTRDLSDYIIVQEKLDGSNVAVARVEGVLIPLIRAGYPAISSKYEQHRLFAGWVYERLSRFEFLQEGERLCGEWLAQAHGTKYALWHEPFVPFDIMIGQRRLKYRSFDDRVRNNGFTPAHVVFIGHRAFSIADAMRSLNIYGFHGSTEPVEGAVWRCERNGEVDFLGKYVRPDKQDGCYLPELSGVDAIWNWRPQ